MTKLKQISLAAVLMFTLATGAVAGITECPPGAPPPPPAQPSQSAAGITDTPPSAQTTSDASDSLIDLTLTALQSVLSVF